jgi:hypothetical protein
MALHRTRNLRTTPGTSAPNLLTVNLTFAAPVQTPTITSADFPHGHTFGVTLQDDDGGIVDQGYAALVNEFSYPDNAGGTRKVGLGLALNGRGNTLHDGSNPAVISFQQLDALFKQYPSVVGLNHSADHGNIAGSGTPTVQTAMDELTLNQQIFSDQIQYALGGVVIPAGLAFFVQAAINLGLPIVSSGYDFTGQGQPLADGYNDWVSYVDGISLAKYVPGRIPVNTRFNADNLWVPGVAELKSQVNQHLANAKAANDKRVFALFSHTPNDPTVFSAIREFIAYCLTLNGGKVWMGNIQEFWDFKTVAAKAIISAPVVNGNQVTFTIDRSQLATVRYWDMSLFVGGGTLTNATVTGADGVTFNTSTGLLNIRSYNAVVTPLLSTKPITSQAAPPTVRFSADPRSLIATLPTSIKTGTMEYRQNAGAVMPYTGPVFINNNYHPGSEYEFRVAAASGRKESNWTPNQPVPAKVTTPTTPGADNDPALADAVWNSGTRQPFGKIPYNGVEDVYCTNNVRDEEGQPNWADGTLAKTYNAAPKLRDEIEPTKFRHSIRKYRPKVSYLRIYSRDWTAAMRFYYIPKASFTRVLIGEVQPNQGWVQLNLPQPTDVTWLETECGVFFDSPSEFEIYGTWVDPPTVIANPPRVPFSQMFRYNDFFWNVENGGAPGYVIPLREDNLRDSGGSRQYLDWQHLEPLKGKRMFSPSSNDNGSWDEDMYLRVHKRNALPVTMCLKNSPGWLSDTWPAELRTSEQLTVEWQGDMLSTIRWAERPEAYLAKALTIGQIAMRYGPVVVDPSRIKVFQTAGNVFPGNQPLSGLDILDVIEGDNERDSWWKGRQGYANGRMMAAADSAYYDGHMGTLGPDAGMRCIGITRLKYSVQGRAVATLEHERGYADWCREFRGYNADGSINLPFDLLNYHAYATDQGITQTGNITRGLCPELANYTAKLNSYTKYSAEYCQNKGVIIGEFGYDEGFGSSQAAVRTIDLLRDANGNVMYDQGGTRLLKPEVTLSVIQNNVLDWALRSCHEVHGAGGVALEWYMLEDASTPRSNYDRYSSCGVYNYDGSRRPTAYAYRQVKTLIGEYLFDSIVSQNPRVHKLKHPTTGKLAYALWSPTETAVVRSYNLNVAVASTQYTIQSNSLTPVAAPVAAGSQTITVTERPIYVLEN